MGWTQRRAARQSCTRRRATGCLAAAHLGAGTTSDDALTSLRGWPPEISDEPLGPPRVVALAGDFNPAVTSTALFYETGLDIRLIRYQLYRTTTAGLILTVSQLLPVPEAEEFMVRPRSSSTTQIATRVARERRASIPQRLIKHNALSDGALLIIVVPDGVGQDGDTIGAWLAPTQCAPASPGPPTLNDHWNGPSTATGTAPPA